MPVLSLDFETRSTVELRRAGVYRYAEHPSTGFWCMAWAFDDEEPAVWFPGEPLPQRIVEHVLYGGELRAHNAQFERIMWNKIGAPRHGFPAARLEQWHCSAAEAAAMGLPRSLGELAVVLGVRQQKDAEGNRLMLQMCRPRNVNEDGPIVWWSVPDKIARLATYCQQDVRTEHAVSKVLRRLGAREREVYLLDQRINDRGVRLDIQLATAAKTLAEQEIKRQNALIAKATDGRVETVTRIGVLKEWLAERGIDAPSLNKAALRELLSNEQLPDDVAAALSARQEAAKSSVAKIDAMLDCVSADGRMRGLLLYHGASTGRWSGRLVQPQNFLRPTRKQPEIEEQIIPAILRGDALRLEAIADALRAMMVPHPGHEFVACDFSSIEARVLAWVAGQHDLVEAFRAKRKVYHEMAARVFNKLPSEIVKPSPEYQIGKNLVLGCGYQMGGAKFCATVKAQDGLDIPEEKGKEYVGLYRSTYPRIASYWTEINDAALDAVAKPGDIFPAGPVKFTKRGAYLWAILPSGRPLAYAAPRIVERETPWGSTQSAVEYSGLNSYTRKWERMSAYGGLWTENVVQAISRDLLAEAMLRAEKRAYVTVLTVHDEIVTENETGRGSVAELEALMSVVPGWADGCPVAAEGWMGSRYQK